jgi:hypothetical protein
MPDQVPGPRENTGKKQAHSYGAGCPHFNGSLLELRAVMLTGVTEDDIFRIAIARHFGKFKPNSYVPCEADMCVPLQERILIVKSDVVEFQNHAKHMLVIIRIPRCERTRGLAPGRDQRAGYSGSRLSIMGLQATACLLGRPCKRRRASLHNTLRTHPADVD